LNVGVIVSNLFMRKVDAFRVMPLVKRIASYSNRQ